MRLRFRQSRSGRQRGGVLVPPRFASDVALEEVPVGFVPSPGHPSYDVTSLGGSLLVRLTRSVVHRKWDQREAARSLGLRKIRGYSVIDATNAVHRGWLAEIKHLVELETMHIHVPPGRYRFVHSMGGLFLAKGTHEMSEIKFGIDKLTGGRYFEASNGEYLQWIPRDGRTASVVWSLGRLAVDDAIKFLASNHQPAQGEIVAVAEFGDGSSAAFASSEEFMHATEIHRDIVASLMIGYESLVIKWLSPELAWASAPTGTTQFSQISVICDRSEASQMAKTWLKRTASPQLGRKAEEIAQRLASD